MRYYTDYKLRIVEGGDFQTDYASEISKLAGYSTCFEDGVKWYYMKKDMIAYSKKYPNVVFEITGMGEEQPDMWKAYFKNGKYQWCQAKISYEPYNESKLS